MDKIKTLATLNGLSKNTLMETLDIEFVDVGDRLFQMNAAVPELIGVVSEIATNSLKIDTFTTTPVVGLFSFSKKNERVEGGEIRGYYMNVFLESDATDALELFAIQSNIIKSHV